MTTDNTDGDDGNLSVVSGNTIVGNGNLSVVTGDTAADDGDLSVTTGAAAAADGKVPSASPTDMLSLDSRFRGNDGAVVVGGGGGGVDDGAIATRDAFVRPLRASFDGGDGVGNRAVAVGDGHVRPVATGALRLDDETIVTGGNHLKSSFPRKRESRTKNSAQPTEFDAAVTDNGKVPTTSSSDMSSLDSRVRGNDGAGVVGDVATVGGGVGNRAVVAGIVATTGGGG